MKEKNIIELFKIITKDLTVPSFVKKGIGEDAAVLEIGGSYYLITTDLLIEDTHFKQKWISPFALGYKALAVNLSDIAAMGGKPEYFLISIGIPKDFSSKDIDELIKGLKKIAQKYQVFLIGGDTVRAEKIVINITVLGKTEKKPFFRSGAKVGDIILVSRFLGDAAAGLAILENNLNQKDFLSLINAHLFPEPEVDLGLYLAETQLVHAAIDISDGIASDLMWICEESNVGAKIYKTKIPISSICKKAAHKLNKNPLEWALSGGEDYALLFTIPPNALKQIKEGIWKKFKREVFVIGEITEGNKVLLVSEKKIIDISGKGFSHF
ncbi:MAG: thiamine-phosphate kinase [Candidatus Desulfofervidus auxilii]|nr:thiamine-phosphate kinase [Candidatus Desulfofervidus auxilii]